jgi:glutamate 5-kinase
LHFQDGQFSDNDGLAALVAEQMGAQLLVLLTDVEGVYNMSPSNPEAKLIHTYTTSTAVEVRGVVYYVLAVSDRLQRHCH